MRAVPCDVCRGGRLKPGFASGDRGRAEHPSSCLRCRSAGPPNLFPTLDLTERDQKIAHLVVKEVSSRLEFLVDVGLDLSHPGPVGSDTGRR